MGCLFIRLGRLLRGAAAAVVLFGSGFGLRLQAADEPAAQTLRFEFALYFAPKPADDPEKVLARLLAEKERHLHGLQMKEAGDAVAYVMDKWVPLAEYAPPKAESLKYFGVGVSPEEWPKLAAAERAFILVFTAPKPRAFAANRAACALLADLANATDGRIWDEETRQLYSLERWRKDRIESWQGGLPDLPKHVTMHAYADPDLVRIITLGMRKFGLPDLVIDQMPNQHTRPLGNAINAFMQRLAEGQRPVEGKMTLVLADIRHAAVKARQLENPGKGAKGAVVVSTKVAVPEEGDPQNTLWLLDFPEAGLAGRTERALWAAGELYGSTDSILGAKGSDAELAAARTRARQAFFAQEAHFRAGLAFKEHLLVKAPFHADGGTEYMWVEVVKWREKDVEGILTSDPYYVKDLHAGSRVIVPLADVYDYILYKPDGSQEGNETGRILQQREGK